MFVRVSRCWTSVPFQSSTRSPVKLHHVTYTFRPGPPAWKRKSGRRLQGVRFLRIQRIAVNRRFIQWEQKLYWTHPGKLVRWSDAQTSSCCWFVLSRALSMFLHWIRSRSASATGNRLRSSQNACFFFADCSIYLLIGSTAASPRCLRSLANDRQTYVTLFMSVLGRDRLEFLKIVSFAKEAAYFSRLFYEKIELI